LSLLGGVILAVFLPIFRIFLAAEISIYIFILAAIGVRVAVRQKKFSVLIGLPVSIATMHIAYGTGFLWSMIKGIFTNLHPERS
jgi:hypothetical protein